MFFLTLILQHFILVFTTCFSYFGFTPFYFRFYTFFSLFVQLIKMVSAKFTYTHRVKYSATAV